MKVLIADNDRGFRKILQRLLKRDQMTVVGEAEDGEQAMRLTREFEPEVVLMDIGMPKVDGLEATRRIKAGKSGTRVVIVTVHDEEAYRRAATDSGADGFVVKKSVASDLHSTITGKK